MKRMRTRDVLFNAGIAAVVSVPMVIGIVNATKHPKVTNPPQEILVGINDHSAEENATTEELIEYAVVAETEWTPFYEFSFMCPVETTEQQTEPPFDGYEGIPMDRSLQVQIKELCDQYQISFELIMAVIKTESNFHTDSIGDDGRSIGLMQIQPEWWQGTADDYGLDIYEPIDNVELGIIILEAHLENQNGDLNKALKKYNTGNPDAESNVYVDAVMDSYQVILAMEEGEGNDIDR